MARLYIAVNGDDVGSKIGDAIASNDHMALQEVSGALKDSHSMIEEWVTSKGGQVISSSGDEGLYICPEECLQELDQIRQKYSDMSGHTITIGIGNSMADASKAMIYGKLNNKNQVVHYEPMIDDYLSEDQVEDAEQTEDQAMGQDPNQTPQPTAVPEGQQKQVLNEEQMSATPTEEIPEMMGDPNDNMENPENEVGEPGDALQDDDSVDEYEKTDPEQAIGEVVQQEENKDIAEEKGLDQNDEEVQDAIEGEMDDMDPDAVEHDEEVGNEDEDRLRDMVHQDMESATQEDEEMYQEDIEETPQDDHADIKGSVMECLQIFKQHKPDLDVLSTQNPELHSALIHMLQCMIEMGHRLSDGGTEGPGDADELNEYSDQFPDAEHEDAEADEDIAEEELDEHNEEEHGEDPEEDSAIEDDADPEEDATPEEDSDETQEEENQENTESDEEKEDDKEKLEKK